MKIFVVLSKIFVLISFISCDHLVKRQTDVNNIQSLLQELEKANLNINEIGNNANKNVNTGRNDTPVRDALGRLFVAFQQLTSAYVGVLTSVGKSIGIPTIGNSVEFLQTSVDAPIGIKQIVENFRQLQDSVQEVTNSVTNLVTRQGPVDNYVLLNEMSKFLGLWSKQVQEVSEQVTRAFGGLEAESGTTVRTIPPALTDLWQNMVKVFDDTVNSMVEQVNRLITGDQQSKNGALPSNPIVNREDQKPSNVDLLKEFKNLLEIIQKRMKNLTQQLDNLIGSTGGSKKNNTITDHNLIAEHKEGRI